MNDECKADLISASRIRLLVEQGWLPESSLERTGVDGEWAEVAARILEKHRQSADDFTWLLI